jgi:hypothetical protein
VGHPDPISCLTVIAPISKRLTLQATVRWDALVPICQGAHAGIKSSFSEMGRLMRSLDWSKTPLGDPRSWPEPMQTAVSICLNSRFPMVLLARPGTHDALQRQLASSARRN